MKYSFFFLAASVGILAACSGFEKDIPVETSDGVEISKVIFNVLPVIDDDAVETRASAIPQSDYNVTFAWEETDRIGIFPNKGSQIYFEPEDGVGTNFASFDGGGWALKSNSTYISYYPFVADFDLNRNAIPISFTGQKQTGTEGPFDGARWVLATSSTTSQNGILTFEYSILNTIINVLATLPAGTYTKASLTISEPLFVEEGTISLDEQEITGTTFSKKLEIALEDFTLASSGTVPIYFMAAPVDLTGKEIRVSVTKDDGTSYSCIKTPSGAYNAGRRRGLTCDQMKKDAEIINFADAEVKRLCVENWDTDGDGELDMDEAAAVTDLGEVFTGNEAIVSFDELQYFTGLTTIEATLQYDGLNHGFKGATNLVSVILPETITNIGVAAFMGCSSLADISLPSSLQSIDSYAFGGCTSFETVSFPSQQIEIDQGAFSTPDRIKLNNISSVKFNGPIRFSEHVGPQGPFIPSENYSLFIGKDCTSIDNDTPSILYDEMEVTDAQINSITVEEGNPKFDSRDGSNALIETATNSLILGCESTVIPESITSIGRSAFMYCSFSTIDIPQSVNSIGEFAFTGCSNLTSIICRAINPPSLPRQYSSWGDAFYSTPDGCLIYVPVGSVNAYKTAEVWSEYADRIHSLEEYVVPDPGNDGND